MLVLAFPANVVVLCLGDHCRESRRVGIERELTIRCKDKKRGGAAGPLCGVGGSEERMNSELSASVFEWLLAGWAGHQDNPSVLFPSLQDANVGQLNAELNQAIHEVTDAKAVMTH